MPDGDATRVSAWLENLSDKDFDHVWVAAVMSQVIEEGYGNLAMLLVAVRDRYRGVSRLNGFWANLPQRRMGPSILRTGSRQKHSPK